ncbi:hypothetical protein ACP4OV_028355 [Aristida adscensionis]
MIGVPTLHIRFPSKKPSPNAAMQTLVLPDAVAAAAAAASSSSEQPRGPSRVSLRTSSAARAPRRESDPKKRVVITGMGVVSVFGSDVGAFYDRLLAGESVATAIDRFDASRFATRFAAQIRGFSSEGFVDDEDGRRLDDSHRYAIVAAKKALESAGLAAGSKAMRTIDKERAGVVVGSGFGGIGEFAAGVETLVTAGPGKISPSTVPLAPPNAASALVAMDAGIGFLGPNYSVAAACATANHCLHSAADQIRLGRVDAMVSGGAEAALVPAGLAGFAACGALSRRNGDPGTASRPWDMDRDGFVMGEGAGVLVMESLEHAMRRDAPILAEYLGGAATCDAYHMTDPRPDGRGIALCVKRSLEDAGVAPEEVNYINAHATSSPAGDVAEVNALKKVFRYTFGIKMNATKSMIGHCLGAAGGLEAVATIKAITTGWVHPTINQFNPEPAVAQFDTVPGVKKRHHVHVEYLKLFRIRRTQFGGSVCTL